jgi:hypothetical protein
MRFASINGNYSLSDSKAAKRADGQTMNGGKCITSDLGEYIGKLTASSMLALHHFWWPKIKKQFILLKFPYYNPFVLPKSYLDPSMEAEWL